jgi:DNA polymerase III epsilon subunit-like protein
MSTSPPGTSYSGSTMSLLDDHTIRFAVVDVETSGLDPQRHLLLQVGVVVVDGSGQVLDRWASLIRPERRWWFSVGPTSIHGIRRRDVRGAPPAVDVLQRLARSLDGAVFVAHNASFDRSFLRAAADAHGVAVPLDPTLCTLQLSRRLDPERRLSHKLIDLCARYDVLLERPHDALADADATAAVLGRLLEAHGITSRELLDAQLSVE